MLYLATMAFFLALDGRGFAEFGSKGVRADEVIRAADDGQEVIMETQLMLIRSMEKDLQAIEATIDGLIGREGK